jgi:hypothetical protein
MQHRRTQCDICELVELLFSRDPALSKNFSIYGREHERKKKKKEKRCKLGSHLSPQMGGRERRRNVRERTPTTEKTNNIILPKWDAAVII